MGQSGLGSSGTAVPSYFSGARWHEDKAWNSAMGVRLLGRPIVDLAAASTIALGSRSVLVSRSRPTALGVSRPTILRTLRSTARIAIGDDAGLSGTPICAAEF